MDNKKSVLNLISVFLINRLPLLFAFLSELDVIILSMRGHHFELWYVLLRLIAAIVILLLSDMAIKRFLRKGL